VAAIYCASLIHLYNYALYSYTTCALCSSVGESIQLSSMAARLRLFSLAVNARLLSSFTVIPRLTWRMCYLFIYLRPLLLNEPFVVTVETSVRVTMEVLLLAIQRSIVAFPWKCLFWIPKTCNNIVQYFPHNVSRYSVVSIKTG
jgi:hypothetical protein